MLDLKATLAVCGAILAATLAVVVSAAVAVPVLCGAGLLAQSCINELSEQRDEPAGE